MLLAASRKAKSTNNTKMSQKKKEKTEIYIGSECSERAEEKTMSHMSKLSQMTQMRSGLLTDPSRNPDLGLATWTPEKIQVQIRLPPQLQLKSTSPGRLLAESCQPRKTRINSLKVASQNFVEISQLKGQTNKKKKGNKSK